MGYRKPDLAGAWYPGGEREVCETIEGYIGQMRQPKDPYKGIGGIVPHAGWYFSGRTAFSVFYSISKKDSPQLVWLFGMHLPPGGPDYIFIDDGYQTPLGNIPVHREAALMLSDSFDFLKENARSYSQDNTIEVQLPFVKYLFPEASIVTVGVSPSERAAEIGDRAASISRELGVSCCFIGSTDLTHYGPNYAFTPHGIGKESVQWVTQKNDREIIDMFLDADGEGTLRSALSKQNACCPGAAAATIGAVKKSGVRRGVLVQYTTSYDIHPDSSFVGYAGVVY
jgi:AmmeMemoRadiSam system protein B